MEPFNLGTIVIKVNQHVGNGDVLKCRFETSGGTAWPDLVLQFLDMLRALGYVLPDNYIIQENLCEAETATGTSQPSNCDLPD